VPVSVGDELSGCLMARFDGPRAPSWLLRWLDSGLAGVLLYADNIVGPDQLSSLVATLREHNPHVIVAADEEGGIVTRLEAGTGSSYPGNAALGAVDDLAVTRRVAQSIGAMMAASGLGLNLAPVADVDSNEASPVIGVRSFGADPAVTGAHTAAFVAGLQANRVAACAKHFPGHGRAATDPHLELPSVNATLAELRATDLVPFRAAIEAGVKTVMTAHVRYPQIDDVPATLSRRLLHGLLREELGFDGVIITDALGMAAIGDAPASAAGAIRSLPAGADLLCLPAGEAAQRRATDTLAAALHGGLISRERVADAAARVRALADWARPVPVADPDPQSGATAARLALLLDGVVAPLVRPPYVLDAGGRISTELADSAGSLLGLLRDRMPGISGLRLAGRPDLAGLDTALADAAGRPLIVVVRDAHRHEWQRELLGRALGARADALVIGTGTVHDRALAGASYLGTRGASRASLTAAADLLAGRPAEAPLPRR
jgi:beta-N-acetylhexosaminidase